MLHMPWCATKHFFCCSSLNWLLHTNVSVMSLVPGCQARAKGGKSFTQSDWSTVAQCKTKACGAGVETIKPVLCVDGGLVDASDPANTNRMLTVSGALGKTSVKAALTLEVLDAETKASVCSAATALKGPLTTPSNFELGIGSSDEQFTTFGPADNPEQAAQCDDVGLACDKSYLVMVRVAQSSDVESFAVVCVII
jgi:hypothetical protein